MSASAASPAASATDRRRSRRTFQGDRLLDVGFTDAIGDLRVLGTLIDLSPEGFRVRLRETVPEPAIGQVLHVRLALPTNGALPPFAATRGENVKPAQEWRGRVQVRRVRSSASGREAGCQLLDLDRLDRAMLQLYLAAQPFA